MSIDETIARPSDEKLTLIEHLARRLTLKQFIFAIVLAFFLVSILFPFYWMVSSSFKNYAEIGGREAVYIPSALRLDAYRELFDPVHQSLCGKRTGERHLGIAGKLQFTMDCQASWREPALIHHPPTQIPDETPEGLFRQARAGSAGGDDQIAK